MLDGLVILLRLLQYGGAVVLLGTPLFLLYGLRASDGVALGWPRPLLIAASAVVALGSVAALVAQTSVMAGSITEGLKPATLGFMITGTSVGPAFLARALVAAAALLLLVLAKPSRWLWIAVAVAGLVVSASFAWTGHGAATEGPGRLVHVAAAILHSWGAAVWLGALVALLILTVRHRPAPAADRVLHQALHDFAGVGTASVAVLVLSGLVNSWFLVGPDRLSGLLTTPYGLLLTGKLVIFALMLVLAAANRFHLTPDLASALDDPEDLRVAVGRLKRSLVAETLLALALLALVAVMGTLAPVSAMDMAM
ncbi:MAG: copper homeostasis membrane protein CopD [Alphaproteobacteria bacterium]|nr:copper homeostasis membrane protein CopD [Alphaproteobacteria bacterium]MBU2417246.1 copper homeostasis membrane protein CopD [Alphaproteobacteria bacterium]